MTRSAAPPASSSDPPSRPVGPRGPRRRLPFVALAAAAVAALISVAPVGAGTAVSVFTDDELSRFGALTVDEVMSLEPAVPFGSLGFTTAEQQLVRGLTMPVDTPTYAFGDTRANPPVITPPGTDPVGIGSMQVIFEPGQLPGPAMTDTGYMVQQGDLVGVPMTVVWTEFGSPVDLGLGHAINEGAIFSRPSRQPWASAFPADTWQGADLFPTAIYNPNPFELTVFQFEPPQTFTPDPQFPGFVMRQDEFLIVGVSTEELTAQDPLETVRYGIHMHHAEVPQQPGVVWSSAAGEDATPEDLTALTTNPPHPVGSVDGFATAEEDPAEDPADVAVEDEPLEEVPAEDPADVAVEDEPLEEVPAEDPADVAVDEEPADSGAATAEPDDSGSFREWVPIILVIGGLAIAVGGFWIYHRTRERDRTGGSEPGGAEPPPEDEDGDDEEPRDVAVPAAPVEHTTCDWELHYWTGAKWEVLRAAPWNAHKCCIYKIRVETKVTRHEQAASFRQDVRPERLYIPDFDYAWRGPDFEANASTRSGPEGRQDWMHGLGNPIDQAEQTPVEGYWQSAQGEEPPEVASHLAHSEVTRIAIDLESGCTDPVNTYTSSGDSSLSVMATHECTNDAAAPECPVELNAFGWQFGEVWGELDWVVYDEQGTDIDELERTMAVRKEMDPEERSRAPLGVTSRRTWDSHDHEVRDRITYEAGDFDSGADVKKSLSWTTWVETDVELDAGQLVPMHVWPTTERVSTHIEQQMKHNVAVSGEMKKGDCAASGCCTGHAGHVCNCHPEFKLNLDGTGTDIVVDAKTFRLERDPATADRREPPTVADPPVYRAWKLI